MDLENLFQQLLSSIRLGGIKPTYIRRMPQAGRDRKDPPAIKVTLLTIGDKVRIYNAFDAALKEHKTIPFGIANEIPQYALGSYKLQLKIAAEIRAKNPGVKTRVGIARNATWPAITVKGQGGNMFIKVDDKMFEDARMEVMQKQKKVNETKRERKREAVFMSQGLEEDDESGMNMDTTTSIANSRPERMAKKTEKLYK